MAIAFTAIPICLALSAVVLFLVGAYRAEAGWPVPLVVTLGLVLWLPFAFALALGTELTLEALCVGTEVRSGVEVKVGRSTCPLSCYYCWMDWP